MTTNGATATASPTSSNTSSAAESDSRLSFSHGESSPTRRFVLENWQNAVDTQSATLLQPHSSRRKGVLPKYRSATVSVPRPVAAIREIPNHQTHPRQRPPRRSSSFSFVAADVRRL